MYEFDPSVCKQIPTWFQDILEYQELCQTETEQFTAFLDSMQAVENNFFFQTMDIGAISIWEKIFRIIPNPETETLDFRRTRLINRVSTKAPFTLGFLYRKLDELIGVGKWKVKVDHQNYTLYIEAEPCNKNGWDELLVLLNTIKPAHIMVFPAYPFSTTLYLGGALMPSPVTTQLPQYLPTYDAVPAYPGGVMCSATTLRLPPMEVTN